VNRKLFLIYLFVGFLIFDSLIGQNLEKHRWEKRILIVQTSDQDSKEYVSQLREFKNSTDALKERKLVLYELFDGKYRFTDFQKAINDQSWKVVAKEDRIKIDERALFKITLIGLDGGIKLEKTQHIKMSDLADIIDAMPMRIGELERQKKDFK